MLSASQILSLLALLVGTRGRVSHTLKHTALPPSHPPTDTTRRWDWLQTQGGTRGGLEVVLVVNLRCIWR